MAINAENKGSNLPVIAAGNYGARCYSMIHIGTIEETIPNKPPQMINKVQLTFELPDVTHIFDEKKGAEPRVVGKEFTLSMNEKSKLRKFLESWRGVAFTEQEVKCFDVTKLIGVPCLLNLIHKASTKGNVYSEITTAAIPPVGFVVKPAVNPNFEFNFADKIESFPDVPKFIREKIVKSVEWGAIDHGTRMKLLQIAKINDDAKAAERGQTTTPPTNTATNSTPVTNAAPANSGGLPF